MIYDHRMSRRSTLKLAGAGALVATAARAGGLRVLAQDATPAAGGALSALGLPELNITVTDTAYEGLASEVTAGTYLVHVTNSGSTPGFVAFMQLPEGMTSSDLLAMLGGGAAEGATPVEGEEEGGAPPDWFYTTYIPGGAGVDPGGTATFVFTLQPGNYVVWGEDPTASQAPVDLTVSGSAATPLAEASGTLQADVTIEEVGTDSGFAFTVQGDFGTGSAVVEVVNNSDQPHFVSFDRVPDGTTLDQVEALLQSFMTGTPTAGGLTEADVQTVYFVGTQSANTTQWHEVSLDPGTYVITCWIPDMARGGMPHALEGMYELITVGGGAMGTPTS